MSRHPAFPLLLTLLVSNAQDQVSTSCMHLFFKRLNSVSKEEFCRQGGISSESRGLFANHEETAA